MSDKAVFHNPLLRDGFAQVPNAVMRHRGLSPQAKCLYTLLLTYAWRDSSCFPSQKTLATDLGISDRYVREILKELEREGFLQIQRQGLNKPNIYHFLDFYADRNPGSAPEGNGGSNPDRKGSAAQGRKSGSSEPIRSGEYPITPPGSKKAAGKERNYGVYTRAVGAWIEQRLRDTGRVPTAEKINEIYEKMKRGERLS